MKTEINANGLLTIKAETDLERYALQHWLKENLGGSVACRTDNLIFDCSESSVNGEKNE